MTDLVQIKKYISFEKGRAPKETYDLPMDGLVPYLSPEYLRDIGKPLYVKPNKKLAKIAEGEIIILWDGSNAGEIFISRSGILASTMTKIVFDENEFDKKYFGYALKYNEYFLKAKTAGSGIPHVDKGIVKKLEIFKPDIIEQRFIADIINKVDDTIVATKSSLTKTESLKKSLMQNILSGKLKTDGTWRKKDEFRETKIGYFPKDWQIKKVIEISNQVTDGEHLTPKRTNFGNYLLSARNIKNGFLELSNVDYVDDAELNKIQKRCNPERGDLLISCSGTIGNVCIVPEGLKCGLVRSVALVKLKKELIEPEFVEILFQSPFMLKQNARFRFFFCAGELVSGFN